MLDHTMSDDNTSLSDQDVATSTARRSHELVSYPGDGWRYATGAMSSLFAIVGIAFNIGALVVIFKIRGVTKIALVMSVLLVADTVIQAFAVPVWVLADFQGRVPDPKLCVATELVASLLLLLTQLVCICLLIERLVIIRLLPGTLRSVSNRVVATALVVIFIIVGNARNPKECYSETCLERPHVRAVARDRWSLFTGFTLLIVISGSPPADQACGMAMDVTSAAYADYFPFHVTASILCISLTAALGALMKRRQPGVTPGAMPTALLTRTRRELNRGWALFQMVIAADAVSALPLISELIVKTGTDRRGDYGDLMTRYSLQLNAISKPIILLLANHQFRRKLKSLIRRPHISPAPQTGGLEVTRIIARDEGTAYEALDGSLTPSGPRKLTLTFQQDITPPAHGSPCKSHISLCIGMDRRSSYQATGMTLTIKEGSRTRRKSASDIESLRQDSSSMDRPFSSREFSFSFRESSPYKCSSHPEETSPQPPSNASEASVSIVCENDVNLDIKSTTKRTFKRQLSSKSDILLNLKTGDVNDDMKQVPRRRSAGEAEDYHKYINERKSLEVQIGDAEDKHTNTKTKAETKRQSIRRRRSSAFSYGSPFHGISRFKSMSSADGRLLRQLLNSSPQHPPNPRCGAWSLRQVRSPLDSSGLPGAVETPPVMRRGSALSCYMRSTCLSSASTSSCPSTSSSGVMSRPSIAGYRRVISSPGFHRVQEASEDSATPEPGAIVPTCRTIDWDLPKLHGDEGSCIGSRLPRISLTSLSLGSLSDYESDYDVIDEPSGVYLGSCTKKKIRKSRRVSRLSV